MVCIVSLALKSSMEATLVAVSAADGGDVGDTDLVVAVVFAPSKDENADNVLTS